MLDFAQLFQVNRDIGFITDPAGLILAATRGAELALGRAPGDLAGRALPAMDESGELARVVARPLDSPIRVHVGFHLRSAEGRLLTVDAVASALWGPDDRGVGWFIAGQDLPGAVQESRGLRRVMDALVDSLGAAVWSFDLNGTILTWSRGAEKKLGWTRSEAEGRLHASRLFGSDALLAQAAREADAGGLRGDWILHRKDGTPRVHDLAVLPLRAGELPAGHTCVSFDITERRKSEELLRILFEKGRDAVFLVEDDSLRVVEANDEACRLLGYSREDFLGLTVTDLVPEPYRHRIPDVVRLLREGPGHLRDRRFLRHRDGTAIPTDHSVTRVSAAGRSFYLAAARDLREEDRASAALAEAKDFLEKIQDNAGDGFVVVDDQGVIVYANRRMLEMQGLPRDRYVGHPFLEFASNEEELEAWKRAHQDMAKGGSLRVRTTATMASGARLNLEIVQVGLERGGRNFVFAIVRDVTAETRTQEELERRVAERTSELQKSEVRIRAVTESALDAVVGADGEGRVTYWNPRAEELFGWTRAEAVGRSVAELVVPERHREGMRRLQETGKGRMLNRRTEIEARRKDGTEFPVEMSVAAYRVDGDWQFTAFISDISSRRAAQEDLRRSREELERRVEERTRELAEANRRLEGEVAERQRVAEEQRFLLANTRDVVYRHDAQGVFTYLSPAVEAVTGYPVEDWRVHFATYMTDHPMNAAVARYTEETLRTGRQHPPYFAEFRHKDGRRIVMEIAEQAYRENGRIAGIVGIARDVTERHRAAERQDVQQRVTRILDEAATPEEALPRVLQAVAEGLSWPLGVAWRLDWAGPSPGLRFADGWVRPGTGLEAFLEAGKTRCFASGAGLPGGVWASRVPLWVRDFSRDPAYPRRADAEKAGLRAAFALPVETSAGLFAVLEFFHTEPRDPDGELLSLAGSIGRQVGQFVDRRRAERDLRFQKTLLESQSEAAIDGILVVSNDGVMVSFNRRFLEMWDIPPEIARARTDELALQSVIDKLADPQEFLDRVKHLYAHPEEESREEVVLKDGRTFDRFSAPVRGTDGVVYGRVWFFRDVTGRRRTEENLRRAAQETRRAYEDLKQAQEQLIRSEKLASVGMLVSGVAHEINNPLNVMYGNLQLMSELSKVLVPLALAGAAGKRDKPAAARVRKFRQMIRDALKAAGHARGVVQDFRNFARDVRQAEPVDLNACLSEVLTLVQRELRPGVRIVRKLGRIPPVRCLRGQLSQVFLNLVKNAVEAIEKRGTITLTTARKGGGVRVQVADSGRGMTEEVTRKLFEPFFTTKPLGKGLGLGLSISAMIVQNHGGRISVRSRPGRGSVFTVDLPLDG